MINIMKKKKFLEQKLPQIIIKKDPTQQIQTLPKLLIRIPMIKVKKIKVYQISHWMLYQLMKIKKVKNCQIVSVII